MTHVDSVKQGSFEPLALKPEDTLSSLTSEERAAHDLPHFETADPTHPILYLPPLLSKLPSKYDKNDKEDDIPHYHSTEPGPLQTETHLPSIDPVSLSLHRALHKFKPVDDKYAGTPYGVSFNWAQLELPEDEERDWYCVAFRSRRKPGSDSGPLYEQDRLAHEEAVQNGGLLMYWYGVPDPKTGLNLATCIWQSRRHAILASSGPQHILAMKLAAASFAEYRLERWVLRKVKGRRELFVDAYEGGDVGWSGGPLIFPVDDAWFKFLLKILYSWSLENFEVVFDFHQNQRSDEIALKRFRFKEIHLPQESYSMTSCAKPDVLSLYRSILRVAGKLPHPYLSFFHRLHAGHYFRVNRTVSGELLQRKLQRAHKTLRRLEAATIGKPGAFQQVLHQAYGRTGRLRWELMQPHVSDTKTPRPEPIIPGIDRSRPPTYSPTLKAILAAAVAKSNDKTHLAAQLEHPPTLPARADPKSEDAKLLGPLSLRRQVNIRWRFFSQQRDLTWWPLEVDSSALAGIPTSPSHPVPSTGFEGLGMVQEIERLATQLGDQPQSISLRQDAARAIDAVHASLSPPPKLPTRSRRWMRRRYRELLAKIPALVAQPSKASNKGQPTPKYIVRRSSEEAYIQGQGQRRPTTSQETEWIRRADEAAATKKGVSQISSPPTLSRTLRRIEAAEAEAATGLKAPRGPSAVNKRS